LAARNATFLLALILIASPCGCRIATHDNETNKIIEQRLSLPFRQLMLLGQGGREMLESDWTSGHFRLSRHNFEPFIKSTEIERSRTDMIR
jgi:hypothetical protein